MSRVTHISIIHIPLDTRIFEKQCRALAAAGYDVHLVVAAPPVAEIDGVQLHSIADDCDRPPARKQWRRMLRAARWAFRLRPSVYHLHDPHLIPLGLVLKLAGARVLYDVHEDYPAHGRTKLAGRPLRAELKAFMWGLLERLARIGLDGFVCASPAVARRFPAAKASVVTNFPLHREFGLRANGSTLPYRRRPNTVVYMGDITVARGFWEMIRAVELVPERLGCRLLLAGRFRDAHLEQPAAALAAAGRIEYVPYRPYRQAVSKLSAAKVGLILLHPLPNHWDPWRSNKLFEYMGAGLPVIASDLPRWRELVVGTGCGLVADPRDASSIASAIEYLLDHPEEAEEMGRRGREAVRARFNWDGQEARLLSIYREIAA